MKPYPDHAIRRARRLRQDMAWTEKRLWQELRKLGLNVRRQVLIGPYVVDFALLSHHLVIEVDGGCHDLPDVQLRDAKREAWLTSQGFRVMRFRDQQVFMEAAAVVEVIPASLPLRGGKGRDGGGRAGDSGLALLGAPASRATRLEGGGLHPRPCPSPIEGEGALDDGEASLR